VALLFADGAALLLAANFFLLALSLMWLGAAAADVHDIAGPQLRGLGIAIYFFSVNLAAYVIGAPLIGRINDALGAGTNPQMLRYSLLLCPLASVLAALLLWRGSRKLEGSRQ
jgi:MFS family permease